MGCLYQLISPSGKSYLGISSKTAASRFAKHTEHALGKRQNGVLYSALRKYKPENFEVKTLVIANDWQYLCELEVKAIAALGTRYPLGYNMTDGGEGVIGPKGPGFSEKVSVAQRKRFERPDERAKRADALLKGRAIWGEQCASKRIDGKAPWEVRKHNARSRPGSVEHKARISSATKLAMRAPDVASKVKACAIARAADPEWRAKISASKIGKLYGKRSPAFIEKQVSGIKAAWADPIKKAARIEKNRATRKAKEAK
jgi:hypothetical protein